MDKLIDDLWECCIKVTHPKQSEEELKSVKRCTLFNKNDLKNAFELLAERKGL